MSSATPTVPGYLVLAAGDAGRTDGQAVRQVLEVLAAAAPTELRQTADHQDLETALDDLGGRRLVVAGGDGSVHLVVTALLARGQAASTPVGLVPLGTGNDLAQGVGLPLDPRQAASRVVAGHVRALDVLRDSENVVVNAAHAGFGVFAARHAQRLKPVLGVLAYRLGAVWAGAAGAGVAATVAVDGRTVCEDQSVLLVAVMNGSSIGGDTPLCPPADPADGLLDVLVVTDRSRGQRAAFGLAVSRGRHIGLPGVTHRQGRQASVRLAQDSWNIDGELTGSAAAREWQVQTAAWQIVA
ncbi:MAG: diacylglycerol kinase family protein [Egibacteraceae bacterium]